MYMCVGVGVCKTKREREQNRGGKIYTVTTIEVSCAIVISLGINCKMSEHFTVYIPYKT